MDTDQREKRTFTYEEAIELLPTVQKITNDSAAELEALLEQEIDGQELEVPAELLPQYELIVSRWADSILEIGVEVKGLWLVDFDSGGGYYCWRYPEPSLQYFHGYEEGFGGRVQLN